MNIPNHVAIILDGNGRWAKAKGMPRNYGHVQGAKTVEQICEDAWNLGIHYLTVYVHAIRLVLLADAVGFELLEIFCRLVVDNFGIELRADGQIDLRLVNMEERIGIALYHLAGFVAVHNIIGKSRNTRRVFGDGSYCFEGSEYCHNETSFLELNYILPVFLPPSFMPESTLVSNE